MRFTPSHNPTVLIHSIFYAKIDKEFSGKIADDAPSACPLNVAGVPPPATHTFDPAQPPFQLGFFYG
jgi:hypothetical protein